MAADLNTTIDTLLSCACEALAAADRPVCRCGVTVGPPPIGPGQCCDCETDTGGQASVFLERLYPASDLTRVTRIETCRTGGWAADITVIVTRCYPTLNEHGEIPFVEDTRTYAEALHDDLQIVLRGIICCTGLRLLIRDTAVDGDPEAGCSVFAIRVTVDVTPATS